MARLLTTTRSLKSLQPRKEPRHGHGRPFCSWTQAVPSSDWTARCGFADRHADGRDLYAAPRPDVDLASGGKHSLRSAASCPDQPYDAAAKLLSARSQFGATTGFLGEGSRQRAVHLYHRRDALWPGGQKDREHLQYRQSATAAQKRTPLRPKQARSQKLPQLYRGPANHALGLSNSFLHSLSHTRILQTEGAPASHHGR